MTTYNFDQANKAKAIAEMMRELLKIKEFKLLISFLLTAAVIAATVGFVEVTAWFVSAIFPAITYRASFVCCSWYFVCWHTRCCYHQSAQ